MPYDERFAEGISRSQPPTRSAAFTVVEWSDGRHCGVTREEYRNDLHSRSSHVVFPFRTSGFPGAWRRCSVIPI
jgi:hypothetical protein